MFTGLIEEIGEIQSIISQSSGLQLTITASRVLEGSQVGDSIAVNGVCLTATALQGNAFIAYAGTETVARTTVNLWKPGFQVNLERALSPTSRLGGHFVQGHVDGVGSVISLHQEGETTRWRFSLPSELAIYVVEKGSIAINGISLTVTGLDDTGFEVAIIPHTLAQTTLGNLKPGDSVNLETDILAKYVLRMMQAYARKDSNITEAFLKEHGFA